MQPVPPGSVVRYMTPNSLNVAIITEPADSYPMLESAAWGYWQRLDSNEWTTTRLWANWSELELHPEPDKVWAEYTVWRLLNG